MCDTTLTTTGLALKAHSSILTAASSVLSRAFDGVTFDSAIELPLGFSAAAVDAFLTFVYTGVLQCPNGTLSEIMELSQNLEVMVLTEMCSKALDSLLETAQSPTCASDTADYFSKIESQDGTGTSQTSQTQQQSLTTVVKTEPVEVEGDTSVSQKLDEVLTVTDDPGSNLMFDCGVDFGLETPREQKSPAPVKIKLSVPPNRTVPSRRSRRLGKKKAIESIETVVAEMPSQVLKVDVVETASPVSDNEHKTIKRKPKERSKKRNTKQKVCETKSDTPTKTVKREIKTEPTEKKRRQCSFCGKVFLALQMLRYHEMQHRGESRFNCEVCGKGYVTKQHFEAHMRKHTGERPFKCDNCAKGFRDKNTLAVHKRYHCSTNKSTDDTRPVCQKCRVQFWSQPCLDEHTCPGSPSQISAEDDGDQEAAPPAKNYHTCDVCHTDFPRYHAWKAHMRVHNEHFNCHYCSKTFRWEHSLKLHLQQHMGSKSYTCGECNKAFWTKNEAETHARVHSGDRPYPCDFCNKRFKTSSHRAVHHKAHKGEKTHSCGICQKKFLGSNKVKRHMLTHFTKSVFTCPNCSKSFKVLATLKKHMETHEKNLTQEYPDNELQTLHTLPGQDTQTVILRIAT